MSLQAVPELSGTGRDLLSRATAELARAGVSTPRLDAAVLLADVWSCDRASLLARPYRRATEAEACRFMELVRRRAARVPLSHLLGRREFWSLPFGVSRDVLDPRPDSETVVEAALAAVDRKAELRILDLGTGSGCLLLALLSELPLARGVGVDLSPAAIGLARANARVLGLAGRAQFVVGDWAEGLAAKFELIVTNPPYVAEAELAALDPEVRCHEPRLALDGGRDGLDAYRAIAREIPRLLPGSGKLVVECGAGQAGAVEEILCRSGLRVIGRWRDLRGIDRCVVAECCRGQG